MSIINKFGRSIINIINYSVTLKRGRFNVKVPIVAGIGRPNTRLADAHLERIITVLVNNLVDNSCFVDIGANIGQTLIKLVSAKGPDVAYVGFEPNAAAVFYLEKLKLMNGLRNVEILPIGLSDSCTVATMFLSDVVDAGASIITGFRDNSFYNRTKRIALMKGDDVLAALGNKNVAIIKIDVEGAEIQVINGLEETLRTKRPIVLCEILPPVESFSMDVNELRISQAKELNKKISLLGYGILKISRDGHVAQVEEIAKHITEPTCDYIFVPKERIEEVISAINVA